jgi:hypothetical protein
VDGGAAELTSVDGSVRVARHVRFDDNLCETTVERVSAAGTT